MPGQLAVAGDLKMRRARWRASIWPGHAAGIEEKHIAHALISRHMGMAVEQDVHFVRGTRRRNMNQPEADAVALEISLQRPIHVVVAIPPNDTERHADRADF